MSCATRDPIMLDALLDAFNATPCTSQENFRRLYRDRLLEDRTISIKVPQGMQQPFGHAMEPGLAVQARRGHHLLSHSTVACSAASAAAYVTVGALLCLCRCRGHDDAASRPSTAEPPDVRHMRVPWAVLS